MAHPENGLRLPDSPFLYPILDTEFSSDPVRDASKLARAGARVLQFRAKNWSKNAIYHWTLKLLEICNRDQICLIVNDQIDIALVTDVAGVHLGQEDFPVEPARSLLRNKILGLSTHNAEQYSLAQKSSADYIAMGPVYRTTTKLTSNPVLGIENIKSLIQKKSVPVVAIGGIREENIRELLQAGVDGVALISELYRAGDLYDSTCRLMDEIRKYEKV